MDYNLNLDKVVDTINSKKAKLVCIQLPDGLKPKAKEIQEVLESQTKAKIVFWAGSCFGACDVPTHIEKQGFDLLFQWGHSGWKS
jgi:diphthamide biosynthesis enzyme Dph1/Dph2-like protein